MSVLFNTAAIKKYGKQWNELTGWQRMDLQGKVKQVMQTVYIAHLKEGTVVPGNIDIDREGGQPNYLVSFNEKGTAVCDETFTSYNTQKNSYNDNGDHVLSETFDLEGKRTEKKEYRYKGSLFFELVSIDGNGKQTSRITNKYNDRGQVTEQLSFRNDPEELLKRRTHTYDEKGNMLTNIEYDEKDNVLQHSEMRYDEKGLRIYQSTQWADPKMSQYNKKQEYKYNEHGDCIQADDYDLDGNHKETRHYEHQYDSNGKRIKPNLIDDEKIAGEDEDVINDKYGNWIRKTIYHNRIPVSIIVREMIYFDDDDQKELVHLLKNPEIRKAQTKEPENLYPDMKEGEAKWMLEANSSPEIFPYLRYYASQFNEPPSLVRFDDQHIDALSLLNHLKKHLNACEVHSFTTVSQKGFRRMVGYTLSFPDAKGYLFYITNICAHSKDLFDIPDWMDDASSSYVYSGQCVLLRPAEATGKRQDFFEQQLTYNLEKCSLHKKEEKPRIHIIEVEESHFTLTEYPVHDDFVIKDLDVNYGYGFERFHNELMKKFSSGTKGLVLFHGHPGTGKTYYIRHLLRKMFASKKAVIYMPPNMVDHLAEPAFMTFLIGEIRSFSAVGQNCVLLIEDAEPLLEKREGGVRHQGITNLLNMTDGILNDLLNIQIICTFNADNLKPEHLDEALTRPGRLIATKEFKPLPVIDANRLAKRLGIKANFKQPATLAEIYAMKEDAATITHNIMDDETGTMTFEDLTR